MASVKTMSVLAGLVAAAALGGAASAQNATAGGASKTTTTSPEMTDKDRMMVKNCKAMPKAKMMKDKECKAYMTLHPDWMKPAKVAH